MVTAIAFYSGVVGGCAVPVLLLDLSLWLEVDWRDIFSGGGLVHVVHDVIALFEFVSGVISLVTVLTLALWLLVLWDVGGYFIGPYSVRFLLTRGAIAGSRVIICLRVQCWHSTHSSNVSFISLYSDNT